ncbi:MAG: CBS domain-containing protein [Halanaeroarchaeum sp.]
MTTPLETIDPDATLEQAAQLMRKHDINGLVVTASVEGIITSTDIIDAVAEGRDTTELRVADVMTEDVETVTPDLYMEEAAAMLTTYGIKHLPVVDGDFVGMISSSDVTAHLLSQR